MPTPTTFIKTCLISLFSLFLATGIAPNIAWADWILDMEHSGLSYGSIKKNAVGEINHFQSMEGRITEGGDISLNIDLSSVETWADIRNERMGKFLFMIEKHPMATLSGKVDMIGFKDLKVGDQMESDVTFTLNLHGIKQSLDAELIILRLSDSRVMVYFCKAQVGGHRHLQADKVGHCHIIDIVIIILKFLFNLVLEANYIFEIALITKTNSIKI